MAAVVLLDGAMGTELRARGVAVPSHKTSIWSARALLEAPQVVQEVHRDYVEAGADVITIDNYAVTPPLLAREGLEARLEELTLRAVELAQRARDAADRAVRIAGSLPPLETSYRADLVGGEAQIRGAYRRMAELLAPRVDVLLCETLSCLREARAAATAALETDLEVWLSLTLQGNRPGRLSGGERLEDVLAGLADLPVHALLVNCCGANLVGEAMPALSASSRPFGGYANADVVALDGPFDPTDPEAVERRPLDADGYAERVAGWIGAGASIVGGCCGTRPTHIARLRRLLDDGARPG